MPPSLLAGVAAVVAALFWLSARRRPRLGAALVSQAFAALNRAQIALVVGGPDPVPEAVPPAQSGGGGLTLPATARERALFLRSLTRQLAGEASQRLAAIETAGCWGHRACLPLLVRGLRDVDPAVVQAAARAMERFRGRTRGGLISGHAPDLQPLPLPRNVARTR